MPIDRLGPRAKGRRRVRLPHGAFFLEMCDKEAKQSRPAFGRRQRGRRERMHEQETLPYLREAIVFLAAAGVAVPILQALRINPVLGFLALGSLIGPFGLGLFAGELPFFSLFVISELEGVRALAELGVVFLLFTIGLELSLDRLWAMRRWVFGLGSLQILATAAAIGAIAWAFGNTASASVVLGLCLALSSTAIVMQLLMQARRLATPLGRTSFSILLMQDLAVVPALFIVGVLGAPSGGAVGRDLALALLKAALTVAAIYGVGRLALRPAFRRVAETRAPETMMAAILLIVIGTSAITFQAGLSMALGAFLAGLLLAETEYRHQIEVDIEPFKGLLLGLFFLSVGMGIDWRLIGQEAFWIFASALGLFLLKAAIVTSLCLLFGLAGHVALEAGLLLGQAGEFAFVVVGLAVSMDVLPAATGQFMLIVASLSMLFTPLVAAAARRLTARLEASAQKKAQWAGLDAAPEMEDHVVVAGFGRVGGSLADILEAENVPYLALDTDPANVAAARRQGRPVFFGDASRLGMLRRAGAERAQAVVVTMDDFEAAERIVAEAREAWPMLPVYARARDGRHAAELRQAGATTAVPETIEGSLQLAGRVLAGLGVPEKAVGRRLDQQRAKEEA